MMLPFAPTDQGFSIRVISNAKNWEVLAEDWNALLFASRARAPFLTYEWARAWWDIFGGNDALHIIVLEYAGGLACIAPLYRTQKQILGCLTVSMLRFLGDSQGGGDFLDLIVHPDKEDAAVLALASFLASDRSWQALSFDQVDASSRAMALLEAHLRSFSIDTRRDLRSLCPYVPLPDSWDAFLDIPDRPFKRMIEKDSVRMCKKHGLGVSFSALPEETVPLVGKLFELHLEFMRSDGVKSSLENPDLRNFFHRIALSFKEKGWLALASVTLGGEVVAVIYGIMFGQTYYLLQTGCGEKGRNVKAGNILTLFLMQDLLGKACELNYLRGEELYKYYWGCKSRVTQRLLASRNGKGRLLLFWAAARAAAKAMKLALKPMKGGANG